MMTVAACGNKSDDPQPGPGPQPVDDMETVTYVVSNENFPNPERGFYAAAEVHSADGRGIGQSSLTANRLQGRTLFLLEFHLTDYVETDISEEYLQTIRARFQSLRDGGAKCILRFCYSNGMEMSDKPWDATPEQVSRHLAQLTPLIREFYDVIMVVQAGFVGSWGEWYYTENFKNGKNGTGNLLIEPCKALVDALLEAVPEDRQIELRTPAIKMRLYGYSVADSLKIEEAHQPTAKSRLGGHNDCYLSSANDVGTFNSTNDRKYWSAESLFTIMGGESCEVTNYCNCEGTDKYKGALKDLAYFHFTYLNNGYHKGVLKRWQEQGCMEEIKMRLGYRFELTEAKFTKEPQAGKDFDMVLNIYNRGFAPAMNPRDAEIVLTDGTGKVVKTWPLGSDPRYWMPAETTTITKKITLPEGLSGNMTLSLNLPDPCETLHNNSMFSIRLANEDVWNEETGYNKLYSFTL